MGLDQTVTFSSGTGPSWPAVRDLLARQEYPVQVRMIDGELAFPEEEPPDSWRELRLGTPSGMVTVRRAAAQVVLVIWGNAEEPLLQAWNGLAWAFAEAGGGRVLSPSGPQTAHEFRQSANFPPSLRPGQETA
ncbi:MAG: hypothetical protein JO112_16880 [Planctomycetes bacterium]|nr:hypothetical protein [Planctomycetota bacterium]